MNSIAALINLHLQSRGLKLGFFDLDWRLLQGRSHVQDIHAMKGKNYSDEIFTALRLLWTGYNIIGYSYRYSVKGFNDFWFLTNQCAFASFLWSLTTFVMQIIGYYSLKMRKETFSCASGNLPNAINYLKPAGGPYNVQIGPIRSVAIVQKVLSIALVPLNLIVIPIYWYLLHDYENPDGNDFSNLQCHLIGGLVIVFDWLVDNSIFLLINGWPLPLFGVYYSVLMKIHESKFGKPIYNEISLQDSFGITIVIILNLVVLPLLLCLMALIKTKHTNRVATTSLVLKPNPKDRHGRLIHPNSDSPYESTPSPETSEVVNHVQVIDLV